MAIAIEVFACQQRNPLKETLLLYLNASMDVFAFVKSLKRVEIQSSATC